MSNKKKFILATAAIMLIVAIGFVSISAFIVLSTLNTDKIYKGVSIGNIDVSGLTKAEASEKILSSMKDVSKEPIITLTYKDSTMKLYYKDIIPDNNFDRDIESAYNLGRDEDVFSRYMFVKALEKENYNIDVSYAPEKEKVNNVLDSIRNNIEVPAVSATMTKAKDAAFVITKERYGINLDYDKTFDNIQKALVMKEKNAAIATLQETPKYTYEILKSIQTPLGTFSTRYNAGDKDRSTNLKIATDYINGTVVDAGEVMSVNKTIKPRTEANGYKTAHVIVNGEYVDGLGGGICQVATTLYNAVMLSELQVVERRNHSLTSSYVKLGRDATVSGNSIDFKFKNTTTKPIYIQGNVEGGVISYTIFGDAKHMSGNRLDFESVIVKKTPAPADKIIEDPNLPVGQKIVKQKSKEGMVVEVYRLTYNKENILLSRNLITKSTYKAMRGTTIVGTKKINSTL